MASGTIFAAQRRGRARQSYVHHYCRTRLGVVAQSRASRHRRQTARGRRQPLEFHFTGLVTKVTVFCVHVGVGGVGRVHGKTTSEGPAATVKVKFAWVLA
jgi:hypothetical protein